MLWSPTRRSYSRQTRKEPSPEHVLCGVGIDRSESTTSARTRDMWGTRPDRGLRLHTCRHQTVQCSFHLFYTSTALLLSMVGFTDLCCRISTSLSHPINSIVASVVDSLTIDRAVFQPVNGQHRNCYPYNYGNVEQQSIHKNLYINCDIIHPNNQSQ